MTGLVGWMVLAASAAPDPGTEVPETGRALLAEALAAAFGQDRMDADLDAVRAQLQAACEQGQPVACEADRWWEVDPETGLADLQAAAAALRPQCERGDDPIACLVAAWDMGQVAPGEWNVAPAESTDAARLLLVACEEGVLRACVDRATVEQLGLVDDAGPEDAAARLQAACEAGSMAGCRRLGAAHLSGLGVPRDPGEARTLLEQTCDAGHARGCDGLALAHQMGFGGGKDEATAVELYRTACEGGYQPACTAVLPLYVGGLPDAEPERRMSLLQTACGEGIGAACVHVGLHHEAAEPPALSEAAAAWEVGCEQGHPRACAGLGQLLATGTGVEVDLARAVPMLAAACTAKVPRACTALGRLELDGEGLERDREAAYDHFRAACDSDHGPGCLAASEQLRRGRGIKRDKELAEQLRVRACTLGVAEACQD